MPTWKIHLPHILYVASPYETARRLLYPGVVRAPSCSALPRIYIYTYPLSSFGSLLLAGPAVASVPAAVGRAATEAAGECGCCLSSTCQLVVSRRNFLFLGKRGCPGPGISTQLQHSTSQYYIHIHPARKDRGWTWAGGCRTDWRTGVWVSGRTGGRADNGWPGEWVAIGNSSTSSPSSLFCSCMDGGGECDGRVDAAPAEDVPVPHGQPAIHLESDGGPCRGSQLRMAGRRPHRGGSPQRARLPERARRDRPTRHARPIPVPVPSPAVCLSRPVTSWLGPHGWLIGSWLWDLHTGVSCGRNARREQRSRR